MTNTFSERSPVRRHILTILVIAVLFIALEVAGNLPNFDTPLERLELSVRDLSFRLRGVRPPEGDIVIVAIDDLSLDYEPWVWPRSVHAELINKLSEAGARVIGLDVFLIEPGADPENDRLLAEALEGANASVSVAQIYTGEFGQVTFNPPIPLFQEALDGFGITEVNRDDDAIVRSLRAYTVFDGKTYYNWSFEVASLYLGIDPPSQPSTTAVTFNGERVPLNQRGELLVNYAGPARTFPTYSAIQVILGDYPPENFRDKIVLIGATTETLQDIYPTPFSSSDLTPGVEIVANGVNTLITGNYLRLAPPWVNLLLILLAAIAAYWISRIQRPSVAITVTALAIIGYFFLRQTVFVRSGYQLAVVGTELTLFLGVVVPMLDQAVTQEIEKRRVRGLFSRFISPEMVSQIIESSDLSALNKRTELTILFSDIRSFTTLSERLTPEEVVSLLNPYLEVMTEVIHKHGGTVDKYEGDAIVAFFGEPMPYKDHAQRAADAALDMYEALSALKQGWKEEGKFEDSFEIGIGLNSGEVFVGLLGSEQRVNYTIIGDNANLAARLQDQTKEFNWPILISGSTYEQIKDAFEAEFAGSKLLKGKTEAVEIYRLIGRKGSAEGKRVKEYAAEYAPAK